MYPPFWRISRYAVGPDRIADYHVPPGSIVTVSPYLMQRDPAYWPDPDRFDIRRTPNRQLAFGYGMHFCVGAQLARVEGEIALNALLRRFPDLAPRQSQADWLPAQVLRAQKALPLRLR